jgi:hypothetical protein
MAQMELATDVVFKRSAPLRALFQRACELPRKHCRPRTVRASSLEHPAVDTQLVPHGFYISHDRVEFHVTAIPNCG